MRTRTTLGTGGATVSLTDASTKANVTYDLDVPLEASYDLDVLLQALSARRFALLNPFAPTRL